MDKPYYRGWVNQTSRCYYDGYVPPWIAHRIEISIPNSEERNEGKPNSVFEGRNMDVVSVAIGEVHHAGSLAHVEEVGAEEDEKCKNEGEAFRRVRGEPHFCQESPRIFNASESTIKG